ncbi:hypothetical protein HY992_04735 [Candidatus Micrarchaeota archaeon]|nr:hypothetical protein [Candidatus Micrarchaeota archaeon]
MKVCFLLLVLIAAFTLLGCIQVTNPVPGQAAGQAEKEYVCADGTTVVKNVSLCPAVQLAEQADPEMKVCEDMPEVEKGGAAFADYCYMGLAFKRENATICRKLSESKKMDCYSGLATLKEDAAICDAAGTQKNYCYLTYSQNNEDVTACDKITDSSMKDSCYSQYASRAGDAAFCEKIKMANNKDNCYSNLASSQCDSSYCDKIINSNMKEQCARNLEHCSGGAIPIREAKPATPQ